jgi:hypothetical protein
MVTDEDKQNVRMLALRDEFVRAIARLDSRITGLERSLREIKAAIKQLAAERESHARTTVAD